MSNAGDQTSWAPVDLAAVIDGSEATERPSQVRRTDGVALGYPSKQHSICGEPESGKSWVAASAAAYELRSGMHVVVIDFEDTAGTWVERLRALGIEDKNIAARFHYVRPEEPVSDHGWADLDAALELAAMVVIDGTNEGLALHGLNLTDNADVAKWLQIPRRCQRYGAGVWQIDHVTKDRESRGRYPIGAQAKLAAVDVAYSLRVIKPFGRGRDGLVSMKVEKDRPGYVRSHQNENGQIAMIHLSSERGGRVKVALEPPEGVGGAFRPTVLMERLSRAIEHSPGLTKRALRDAVSGKSSAKDLALQLLVAEGFVDIDPEAGGHSHRSIRPFRADGDEEGCDPGVTQGISGSRDPRDPACPSGVPTVPPSENGSRDPVTPSLYDGARGTVPLDVENEAALLGVALTDEEPLA